MAPLILSKSNTDQDLDVIVLGRAGMDLYPLPVGCKSENAEYFQSDLGGSAGNIAVALTRHGIKVGLIAPMSDDAIGRFVANKLRHYGVEHLTPTAVQKGTCTSLAIAENRPKDCNVVIYRNNAADFQITEHNVTPQTIQRAPILIVTGTALAREPSRSSTLEAMKAANQVILDLDYRPYSWSSEIETKEIYHQACQHSNIIIGNQEEFDILGKDFGQKYAEELAKSAKVVIYKMGQKGSITYTGENHIETGVFYVDLRKPFGAGDAFMGGLVAELIQGKPLKQALIFGSAAAAMVVSTLGCASAMPTTHQVNDFMANWET